MRKLTLYLGATLAAASSHGQTNFFSSSGSAGMAAENTLYFGAEEAFGGSNIGGNDYGYIQFRNHAAEYAYWGTSGENSALVIGTQNDGPNSVSDSVVLRGAAANIFDSSYHLFVSGNVGIGMTNPQAKLDVAGPVGFLSRSVIVDNSWNPNPVFGGRTFVTRATFYTPNDTGDNSIAIHSGDHQTALVTDGPIISLESGAFFSGDVGIGTANPQSKLDVAGGAGFLNRSLLIDNSWNPNPVFNGIVYTTRATLYTPATDGNSSVTLCSGTHQTAFVTDGPIMSLESGAYFAGSVGIGTTSPSHKLTVNGTIRAKEVIVDTGWADYVFAEDYRLAPLSEVEAHIKAHKHLPDMPSAADVAEKGVSMGEMQAKLLAKIEELTLHAIEQRKQLDAAATLIAKQAERIDRLEAVLSAGASATQP